MNKQTDTTQSLTNSNLNLRNKHFLKLDDFTPKEIAFLLQLAADPFLFGDVAIQFLDVTLSLFSAFAFSFGARAFGLSPIVFCFFGLRRRRLNFLQILVVGEVNDPNDRRSHEQDRQAYAVD